MPMQALLQPLPWIRQRAGLWDVFEGGMRFESLTQLTGYFNFQTDGSTRFHFFHSLGTAHFMSGSLI